MFRLKTLQTTLGFLLLLSTTSVSAGTLSDVIKNNPSLGGGISTVTDDQIAIKRTNLPLPGNGVAVEECDVSSSLDYSEGQTVIPGSLRERIDLFNAEATTPGQGKCDHLIYFLNPMYIKLKSPLVIKAISHVGLNKTSEMGTYIGGRWCHDTDGDGNCSDPGEYPPLPVHINAEYITKEAGTCAVMIEGGLTSFQQLHDLTIHVSNKARAICDENGNDLMEKIVPDDDNRLASCNGKKAKDCDFNDVIVKVAPTYLKDVLSKLPISASPTH